MSRRDQLFQAVSAIQGQVHDLIDSHTANLRQQQQQSSSSSSSQNHSNGVNRSNTHATLPTYAREGESAPESALNAAPGQAQNAIDQMPRYRMATAGSSREARQAAAALRAEQLQTGQLKTKHTFVSSGARVILDINTAPQRILTFMGSNSEMKGKITIHAQPNERVSAIRLKIKAVAKVIVPRAGLPDQPFALEKSHPAVEPCVEKELLLLQLESQLYTPTTGQHSDPTVLPVGMHEYPFAIDIPSQTSKGVVLPPSFILSPLNSPDQVKRPVQHKSKWEAITSSIPLPIAASSDWASVKWYAKVTIERPGIFRTNERIFAPFVYLPPPPKVTGMKEQIMRQIRLAAEVDSLLRRFQTANGSRPIDLQRLSQPLIEWERIRLAYGNNGVGNAIGKKSNGNAGSSGSGGGFFSKLLFGAQVESKQGSSSSSSWSSQRKETYTAHLPKKPFVFALRSGMPFILSRKTEGKSTPSSSSKLPHVGLFQRTKTFARGNNGPLAAGTTRFLANARQLNETQPVFKEINSNGGYTEHWLGIIDLPASCAPCFETPILTVEYFIAIRHPQSGSFLHSESVVLVCPPPSTAIARPTITSRPVSAVPSRTNTPKPAVLSTAAESAVGNAQPSSSRIGNVAASATSPRPPRPQEVPTLPRPAIPPRPVAISPAMQQQSSAEKRAIQARIEAEQQQQTQAQAQASSSRPAPAANTSNVAPPQSAVPIAAVSAAPQETRPLRADDADGSLDDTPDQWQFHDDELTDLPPSYFEATAGQRDED